MSKEDEEYFQEINIGVMLEKLVASYFGASEYVREEQGFEYDRERANSLFF